MLVLFAALLVAELRFGLFELPLRIIKVVKIGPGRMPEFLTNSQQIDAPVTCHRSRAHDIVASLNLK